MSRKNVTEKMARKKCHEKKCHEKKCHDMISHQSTTALYVVSSKTKNVRRLFDVFGGVFGTRHCGEWMELGDICPLNKSVLNCEDFEIDSLRFFI